MLGYITPDKPELKVKEYELYSAYYCGICKAIKKRHGEIPRLVLSYDSVLLAMIISSLTENMPILKQERCIVHPIKKKNILYDDKAIDYAADMLVVLAYYKFKDDWKDEGKIVGGIGMLGFKKYQEKIAGMYPETCDIINRCIENLSEIETEKCQAIDEAAEPFAQLMKAIFKGSGLIDDMEKTNALGEIGYSIGKWIYLIDAVDDLEKDIEKNRYNPLKDISKEENFQKRIEYTLICILEKASIELEKLGIEKNKGIIENIIYFGLFKRTEGILGLREDCEEQL